MDAELEAHVGDRAIHADWRVLVTAVTIALVAACSGGHKKDAPPGSAGDDPGSATATVAPSPGPTGTIEATSLHAGPPADIPAGAVLYIEGGCSQCDGPATSLDRVYRDGAGGLHSDRLFERQLRVRSMRVSSTGNDIVIGVCERGYCGGVGNATPDSLTTFYGSNDGGITWQHIGQLSGDVSVIAVSGITAWVERAYQATAGGPVQWEIVQLPGGRAVHVDPNIDLKTARRGDGTALAVAVDGQSLLWLAGASVGYLRPELPSGARLVDGMFTSGGSDGVGAVIRWQDAAGAYVGTMARRDGRASAIFRETPDMFLTNLGSWRPPSLLVGNVSLPASALASPNAVSGVVTGVPSLTDLKTGEVRPIAPLVERRLSGDRARILAAAMGPVVKVAAPGDCLNVRETPSVSARSLGCYKDGVLLQDRGETRAAEGLTWVGVWASDRGGGWAASAFLDAPGRNLTPTLIGHPRGTRTGDASLDSIIGAVERRDREALRRLAEFRPEPCTNEPGLGGPPKCGPGMATGTPIEVMPAGGCEGGWWPKDEFLADEGVSRFLDSYCDSLLFAVYRKPPSAQSGFPEGEFIIVYVRELSFRRIGQTLGVAGGRLVSTWGGCGAKPEEVLKGTPGVTTVFPGLR